MRILANDFEFYINMFHVFALSYHSTVFLWPALLFFHHFVSRERERVHCTPRMHSTSMFAFKFLQINRYVKWGMKYVPLPGHVTGFFFFF